MRCEQGCRAGAEDGRCHPRDHGRETVVRTGRRSSSLGRKPDLPNEAIALACVVAAFPVAPSDRWPPARSVDRIAVL